MGWISLSHSPTPFSQCAKQVSVLTTTLYLCKATVLHGGPSTLKVPSVKPVFCIFFIFKPWNKWNPFHSVVMLADKPTTRPVAWAAASWPYTSVEKLSSSLSLFQNSFCSVVQREIQIEGICKAQEFFKNKLQSVGLMIRKPLRSKTSPEDILLKNKI